MPAWICAWVDNIYVSGTNSDNIVRYDGATEAFIDEFIPSGSGGLKGHTYILFTSQ